MKKILVFIALFCGAIIIGSNYVKSSFSEKPSAKTVAQSQSQNTVIINDGKNEIKKEINSGNETAYTVLEKLCQEKKLELVTKKYDFGIFVEQIGDKKSGTDMAWIYYLNGNSGQVAADKAVLKAGDKVEWKYEKPKF